MRTFLAFCLLLFTVLRVAGQLNTRLLGRLEYAQELSDIWGYATPDGTEYALVGTTTGVSVVSLADPANPQEVHFVPGAFSLWRDIKTFGSYAFVTADQPQSKEGLLVIDLTKLPSGEVSSFNWRPAFNGSDTLNTCHNIYIDESGVAYLAGCNVNRGGMLFVDVASAPDAPRLVGTGPDTYAHDVFVLKDRMFASEVFEGRLAIYDVTDKEEAVFLAMVETPFRFTHNAWTSADGRLVFTTDERSDAPVTSYDISRLDNIRELDQYRPAATLGQGVIPHNVHVKGNFLAISYYTDGARIVDAGRPENLVETAFFDSNDDFPNGFHGAWGLYPFLPSGRLLISDIENGLFVVGVDYVRAAYLEGRVTEAGAGSPVRDVRVDIVSTQANTATSDRQGDYRTGLGLAGTFEVVFSHPEYLEQRLQVDLSAGEVTLLDVELTPKKRYRISGSVVEGTGGGPVPGALVTAISDDFRFETQADAEGRFELSQIYEGQYDVFAGAWGYRHEKTGGVLLQDDTSVTIRMEEGYQDDFLFDLGWSTAGDASSGHWERGVPDAVNSPLGYASPKADADQDYGMSCFVTGNGGGSPGDHDVDNGVVQLFSPIFDLKDYRAPVLSYQLWFFNEFGGGTPNDTLSVRLSNGRDTIILEALTESRSNWRPPSAFFLNDLIDLTDSMRLIVEVADRPESGNVVEAAIDAFLVEEANTNPVGNPADRLVSIHAYPNPFHERLNVEYDLSKISYDRAHFRITNVLGQQIDQQPIESPAGTAEIGSRLQRGTYYIVIEADGRKVGTLKVLKM